MNQRKRWTSEDDLILLNLISSGYSKNTIDYASLSHRFGRSQYAIECRIDKLSEQHRQSITSSPQKHDMTTLITLSTEDLWSDINSEIKEVIMKHEKHQRKILSKREQIKLLETEILEEERKIREINILNDIPHTRNNGKCIYVLKLENGKYYVGSTNNLQRRLSQHILGQGCMWTQKYKPCNIIELERCEDFKEDMITKKYMKLYGIDNVRGGQYSQIELGQLQISELKLSMNHNDNLCLNCGKAGHFIADCKSCLRCGRNNHTIDRCYATFHINGSCLNK